MMKPVLLQATRTCESAVVRRQFYRALRVRGLQEKDEATLKNVLSGEELDVGSNGEHLLDGVEKFKVMLLVWHEDSHIDIDLVT